MKATISKIHPPKLSANGDTTFIRVEFILEDGTWAKTDLCKNYRNFKNWEGLGVVGQVLTNLKLKSKNEIDADSVPKICITNTQDEFNSINS